MSFACEMKEKSENYNKWLISDKLKEKNLREFNKLKFKIYRSITSESICRLVREHASEGKREATIISFHEYSNTRQLFAWTLNPFEISNKYFIKGKTHDELNKKEYSIKMCNEIGYFVNYRDVLFSNCYLFNIIVRFYTLIYFCYKI